MEMTSCEKVRESKINRENKEWKYEEDGNRKQENRREDRKTNYSWSKLILQINKMWRISSAAQERNVKYILTFLPTGPSVKRDTLYPLLSFLKTHDEC